MTKENFERQINALIPKPDIWTTASLFAFGQELMREPEYDGAQALFNSLEFISRHFDGEVLQSAYELIQDSASLPEELVAAAVFLQDGEAPGDVAGMVRRGYLMGGYVPKDAGALSPLALCCILEDRKLHVYHTEHFGSFDPETVFSSVKEYASQQGVPVTEAFRHIAADGSVSLGVHEARRLLTSGQPEMTEALNDIFACCPAVAAWISFDVDQGRVSVNHNPLWLELWQRQEHAQGGMEPMV